MLGAVAQFEREIMLARQREDIAAAKAEGKYKGRTPTVRRQAAMQLRLRNSKPHLLATTHGGLPPAA